MSTIRPATLADAVSLAPRLRQADLAEIKATTSMPPEAVLKESITDGLETYAAEGTDGLVIALFGIARFPNQDPDEAVVWMVGSDDSVRNKTAFVRAAREFLKSAHQRFPLLWNVIDARNVVHIKWLKRFGFTAIRRHERLGVEQRPFIEFIRIDTSCVPLPQQA